MGLDSVELIIKVEKHFDISIPDEEAAKLYTVGALHEYVYAALQRRSPRQKGYVDVFDELRSLIVEQLGVDPRHVQPEAHFVNDLRVD
jgi:acyl carrier protein